MTDAVNDGIICGGAVLAGNCDKDFLNLGVGYTSPNSKYNMDANTVLDVASTTKAAAVITALLICHNRGLIDFDAPFTEYLPGFTAVSDLYETITVRDLANHLSGFGDVRGQKQRLYFDESGTKMLSNILVTPPPHPPTRHAVYSCWNYLLLSSILEQITGEKLPDFCRKEIFAPLTMNSTSMGKPLPEIPLERLGQTMGTTQPGEISDFVAMRIYRDGGSAGNAGLFTSAKDFSKLLQCYLRGGCSPEGKVLFSKMEIREISPDQKIHFDGYRKFGWVIYENLLAEEMFGSVLFHSGWSGQTILFDLSRNFYAVVLTTRCGDYDRAKKDRFDILYEIWKMAER